MDTNKNQYNELSKDPQKLSEYLSERIEDMSRILNEDQSFCAKEIEITKQQIQIIEKKFYDKIQELKFNLEQIEAENAEISEQNKSQFDKQIQDIDQLYQNKRYNEACNKFEDCKKDFEKRPAIIEKIPKIHINEKDIEQLFSPDYKSNKSSASETIPTVISSTTTTNNNIETSIIDDDDDNDEARMTAKQRLRSRKTFETVNVNDEHEELSNDKSEQIPDNSLFGIRSRRPENQQTTVSETKTNGIQPSTTTVSSQPKYFSTRLGNLSKSNNLPFSGRNISSIQNNPEKKQSISPSNSISPSSSLSSRYHTNLTLNPVSHYQAERNRFLLMTCNARFIVLFKSPLKRLDLWDFGVIERGTQVERNCDWHDGLIISMGYIGNNNIFIFTEREVFLYSLLRTQKLDTRQLPHGTDEGYELNTSSPNDSYRGIGAYHGNHIYHMYLNRNSHWTLSKSGINRFEHIGDLDLTKLYPDVLRFIHLTINDKTMNFLVQMNDLTYAVVFYPNNTSYVPIPLLDANKPLTIYTAYIRSIKRDVFFINDPSNDSLYVLTYEKYLQSYPITAHAICYVADKHELMIVNNNSISSLNLDKENFFSEFFF